MTRICLGETTLAAESRLSGFHTSPCKFLIFLTVVKCFLTHLRALLSKKKKKLEPRHYKGKILQQFEAAVTLCRYKNNAFWKNSFCRNRQHIRFG